MEFNDVIYNRRSIRSFDTSRKVSKNDILDIVKSAQMAPTWKNSQTARYYCAVDEESIEKILKCLPERNRQNANGASLIVTTFVHNVSGHTRDGQPENECGNGWGYYDLGLANQNLVLKAYEKGLGSLIMGIRDGDELRSNLNISDDEIIVSVIAIGFPNTNPEAPLRKDINDIIHWI